MHQQIDFHRSTLCLGCDSLTMATWDKSMKGNIRVLDVACGLHQVKLARCYAHCNILLSKLIMSIIRLFVTNVPLPIAIMGD